LPPYAKAIEWRRQAGRETPSQTVEIFTGSRGMAEASGIVDLENSFRGRCPIQPKPLAVLPFRQSPRRYAWSFAAGLNVAVSHAGEPEADRVLLALVRSLIEAGAQIVSVPLSGGRLELFKPGEGGIAWKL
jgi:hypothetical protein